MGNEKPYQLNAGKDGGINLASERSRLTTFKLLAALVATVVAFSILNWATSDSSMKTSELRARTEIALCHMGYAKDSCASLESSFESKFGNAY
ncbi:hypothetical protein HX810_21165 [Pseudomonas salomonii]|uniref:Uncharacterized protein n=1 Tax=Pseudomonas salomonii TaxID=191391 RepID=A0A7Y8GG01_9PSED|nr:hypothetical protein [Pseudomonas salomonii]NWF10189.1 hypothetical protein [Pseudomonas salomonii]